MLNKELIENAQPVWRSSTMKNYINRNRLIVIASTVMLALISGAHADVIATWGSTVDDGNLEAIVGNFSTNVGDSVVGSGMVSIGTTHDFTTSESPQITGGEIVYLAQANGLVIQTTTLAQAITANAFHQVSFEVAGLALGETLGLDSFVYKTFREQNAGLNASGWASSQLLVRLNDTAFTTADALGSVNTSTIDTVDTFTINTGLPAGLVNGDVVNFRVYAWNNDTLGGGGTIDRATRFGGVSISGTVIPEPASLALAALGGLLILPRRRAARA